MCLPTHWCPYQKLALHSWSNSQNRKLASFFFWYYKRVETRKLRSVFGFDETDCEELCSLNWNNRPGNKPIRVDKQPSDGDVVYSMQQHEWNVEQLTNNKLFSRSCQQKGIRGAFIEENVSQLAWNVYHEVQKAGNKIHQLWFTPQQIVQHLILKINFFGFSSIVVWRKRRTLA